MTDKTCPKNHNLQTHEAETHVCSVCLTEIGPISTLHCPQCNWNYCQSCVNKCGGRHKFGHDKIRNEAYCDICGFFVGNTIHYYCTPCDYDICDLCYKMSLLGSSQE